jgi:hypothetical protein
MRSLMRVNATTGVMLGAIVSAASLSAPAQAASFRFTKVVDIRQVRSGFTGEAFLDVPSIRNSAVSFAVRNDSRAALYQVKQGQVRSLYSVNGSGAVLRLFQPLPTSTGRIVFGDSGLSGFRTLDVTGPQPQFLRNFVNGTPVPGGGTVTFATTRGATQGASISGNFVAAGGGDNTYVLDQRNGAIKALIGSGSLPDLSGNNVVTSIPLKLRLPDNQVIGGGAIVVQNIDSGAKRTIADRTTNIPGGQGKFTGFGHQIDPTGGRADFGGGAQLSDTDKVVFFGTGSNNQSGLYTSISGRLTAVVKQGQTLPGTNRTAIGFSGWGISGTSVAFLANLNFRGGNGDLETHAICTTIGGSLKPVITSGTLLDGKRIFELRAGERLIEGNKIVFAVRFVDGTEAIYRADYQ